MLEPSLKPDRVAMVKDACLTTVLGIMVVTVTILCLIFAERLKYEGQLGPCTVLVLIATAGMVLYLVWIAVRVYVFSFLKISISINLIFMFS